MCSILGLTGNFQTDNLIKMMKESKHRGPDASGIYLTNKKESTLKTNINLERYSNKEHYNIGFGQNLLSVFQSSNNQNTNIKNNLQPIEKNNIILIFNGEIYNYLEIQKYLKLKSTNQRSDSHLLLELINKKIQTQKELLPAIKDVLNIIDGDYAFAVTDGENIILSRDIVGVKPLYYGYNEENSFMAFASEKKSLWASGITNISNLSPGDILYNGKIIHVNKLLEKIEINENDSFEFLKNQLIKTLYQSVYKRVQNLSEVGLIFSGGVDSTFLAFILKEISKKTGLKVKLYAVGNLNSKDIEYAEKIAKDIDLPLKKQIVTEDIVRKYIKDVLKAIEDDNRMKLGVGMTIFLASKMMKEDGIKVALSGQGADEIFAGYNRYIKHIKNNNYNGLNQELIHDIQNIYHVNLQRDDAASMANGVELRVPYMDTNLINLGMSIPANFKIISYEDNLKKHILREAAITYGVPEYAANRPKKAAQYGSGIDKILKKKISKDFDFKQYLSNYQLKLIKNSL